MSMKAVGSLATEWGMAFALGEITLVFFTTLTPSGVVAALIMLAVRRMRALSNDDRKLIERKLYIPIIVSMVGLIASASHLGTPSNALYVLTGVGRSPLSNEVVSGVVFLALLGVYWYYSFSDRPNETLRLVWRICLYLTGIAFVTFIALAYSVESIISWNRGSVPVLLWLNALTGGPILALVGLGAARMLQPRSSVLPRILLALAAVALTAAAMGYVAQWSKLASIGNFTVSVSDLVPFYGQGIAVFCLAGACGVALCGYAVLRTRGFALALATIGCLLTLTGVFVMRFMFYMMHLTAGLGI